MSSNTPYQLPASDAIFLSMETDNAPGHIGSITFLDPSTHTDFGYDRLAAHIAERVQLVPRFTWKLREVPFGLDHPYWVENPDFDVRDHIFRTAVPAPGGRKEVAALAGRLHSQRLDRSRALWEIWLIEGLADGKAALYMKVHHCLMDGASGTSLGDVLADLSPDADGPPIVPEVFGEQMPAPPTAFELARNAVTHSAERRLKMGEHALRGIRGIAQSLLGDGESAEVPRLSFNRGISRRRAIAWTSLPFEPVKDLKKHFDVKINDVVLEIVGSAMRRYLKGRGELPGESLVALCPVSTREKGDRKLENQVSSMAVPLATELADPAERLARIHESANAAKSGVAEGSFDYLAAVGESLAPALVGLLMGASDLAGDAGPLPGNFVVSNVRATPIPLYLAGAKVDSLMPMSLLQVGQGLNVTAVSYCNRIDVGITVDPDLVPDVWGLAEHFPAALEELEAAAQGVVHRSR